MLKPFVQSFFDRFGKYVELMLDSGNEHTRQEGARLACQAALHSPAAEALRERSTRGDSPMRRGAAWAYAHYIANPNFSQKCQTILLELAMDEDEEVQRTVASCFFNLSPERHLEQLRPFIQGLIQLPAIARDPHHLLEFVTPIADEEHELALQVTQRMIDIISETTERNFYTVYNETVSLPLAVYNRSFDPVIKEKAMKLFEELLDMDVPGATTALNNWDEHRAFAIKVIPDEQINFQTSS